MDLFVTLIAVSVSSSLLLTINPDFEALSLRYENNYHKRLLLSLFNYDTVYTEVSEYLCNGEPDPLDKIVSIIKTLDDKDEHFIMFIENVSWVPNKIDDRLSNGVLFYDNVTNVCLNNVNLINFKFVTNCGEVIIYYGAWKPGEEVTC